jgi:NAD+ synthase
MMTIAAPLGQMSATSELAEQIASWLRAHLESSWADRFVLGLSGGIDSAVVAGLAARGVDSDRVLGIMMPSASNPDDLVSAQRVVDAFGIAAMTIDLTGAAEELFTVLPSAADVHSALNLRNDPPDEAVQLANANVKPRLRMTSLYYVANLCRGIVLGTGNKTESMIGYFTKYGDGGVDLLPLVELYKHEVRELARVIGVPKSVIDRPPSAGLWEGQTDEDEIGITYDDLDRTLAAIEHGDTDGIPADVLARVQAMIDGSRHKRQPAPAFTRG